MTIKLSKHLWSAFLLTGLVACGGGGASSGPGTVNLTGTAGKGLLIGADVTAYESVNGTLSTNAWATGKTDSNGAYSLSGPPTSNPVVVVVTTNSDTEMLDETKPNGDGFDKVRVPTNLRLRSFVESLTQNDTVQINFLTESAVALASNALNSTNAKIGFTKDSLVAAKQFAQQLAPEGVNPFVVKLPAKTSDLADDSVAKMSVMMAGLIQTASTSSGTCGLQCQVEKISKDVPMMLDSSGKGSINVATAKTMGDQKTNLLKLGKDALKAKEKELGTYANQVSTVADAAITSAENKSVTSTTMAASEYETLNGIQSFISTLRASFKSTETKLKTAKDSLENRYHTLTVQGLEKLNGVISTVGADCVTDKSAFTCVKSPGSNVTWTAEGGDWIGKATSSEGYTIEGRVRGTLVANKSANVTLVSGTVKNGAKTLVEINNVTGAFNSTASDTLGNTTAGTVALSGNVKVYDQTSGSDLYVTLALSNVEIKANKTNKTFDIKGQLGISSNKKDAFTGTMTASGVEHTWTQTYSYTYANSSYYSTYTGTDSFITQADLNLTATESSQGEILKIVAKGSQTLQDLTKAESPTNYSTFDWTASVTLAADTKMTIAAKRVSKDSMVQSVDLQSGTSKLSLSGNFVPNTNGGTPSNQWCSSPSGVMLCTNTLSLSANDGTYTASVTKSSSRVTAKLYKGNANTGTQIGVITDEGIIQIDGKEYSLY